MDFSLHLSRLIAIVFSFIPHLKTTYFDQTHKHTRNTLPYLLPQQTARTLFGCTLSLIGEFSFLIFEFLHIGVFLTQTVPGALQHVVLYSISKFKLDGTPSIKNMD